MRSKQNDIYGVQNSEIIQNTLPNMYGGGIAYEQPLATGKRISGLPPRREPGFSLDWDQSNQMNSYQLKKVKGKEITGKITGVQAPIKEQNYDEALEKQKMQQLYQKLAYENPDIPPEQLEQYLYDYEKQQRKPSRQESQYQRRGPIKQKESMRDIIYNGVGVESMEEKRAASRRNNSNLVLGDGYNYFHDNRK